MVSITRLKHWHLYESMPVPCLILAPDFSIVAANQCYLDENNITRQQAIGIPLLHLLAMPEAYRKELLASFHKVMQKAGSTDMLELPYCIKNNAPAIKEQERRSIKNISICNEEDGKVSHILHFAIKINADTSFLADITRNIIDPIITTDKDLNITRWNRAAEKMFGWTSAEAIGNNTIDILRAQLAKDTRKQIIHHINTGGYWHGEVTYLDKWDAEKFALCTVSVFRDGGGHITGNLILIKDITKRKEAETQLALLNRELETRVQERTAAIIESEAKYQRLFENNPLPMWVMNQADFRIIAVNEMAIAHYGYSREEFLNMTLLDIRPDDEKEIFLQADHSPSTAYENDNRGLWKHRKKNGEIIFVEVSVHNTSFENAAAKMILAHDVTHKIKAEEELARSQMRYKTTLNSMLEGVQILDFNWKYVYLNDTIVQTSKYKREQLIGSTIMEKYPGIETTKVFATMQRVMTNRMPEQVENEFVFPDGSVSHFQLSIQPVPEGIFVLSIDITDRKNAEKEIEESHASRQIMMQRVSDSFIALDKNWNYTYVNKAAGEMVKRTPEDLQGKNMFAEFPELVGHNLENIFKTALVTQQQMHAEEYYAPLDLWLESNIYPSPEGISVFLIDISKRKKAELERLQTEENLKAIFNNTAEGFILTDIDGIVKLFNHKVVNSFLRGVSDEIRTGESIFNLVEPERGLFFKDIFNKV
ncbi:MAG: PAS domain S-box protein, partial [Sphingobacteriales bacterium]